MCKGRVTLDVSLGLSGGLEHCTFISQSYALGVMASTREIVQKQVFFGSTVEMETWLTIFSQSHGLIFLTFITQTLRVINKIDLLHGLHMSAVQC